MQKTMGSNATSSRRSRCVLMSGRIFLFRRAVSSEQTVSLQAPDRHPTPPFSFAIAAMRS